MASLLLPETTVLAPLDPSKDTDSDQWPELELSNARVYRPHDRTATTCLLLATEHSPLVVVGDVRLHAVPKHLSHLIRQKKHGRTASIELDEVRIFAYGQYEDGSVALWAAGKAGWFTLKPARAYRDTYNDMIDAIKLLYSIADAYRQERRKGKGKHATTLPPYTADELFERYAHEPSNAAKDAAEAKSKIYKHVDFLIASMLTGKEGIVWTKNPLYLHLRDKFPEEHQIVLERLAGPPKKAVAKPQSTRQQSADTSSTTSSLKRKRGRPPKSGQAADVISIGSSSAAASTAKGSEKQARSSKSTSVPRSKGAGSRRTRQSPVAEAVSEEEEEEEELPHVTATPAVPEISDSEDDAPAAQARKGKSALRLKPSKAAKGRKSTSRAGKAPLVEDDDSEEELASSPTGVKRHSPELADPRPRKRRNSKPEVDEGIDMPDSPSASDPIDTGGGSPDAAAGARNPLSSTVPLYADLATRLKHAPDPIQEDTWLCALDGCTHKVYLASQPESQSLIREHYALHAYDDDERVQLVSKLKQPSLPVQHLMEKVRLQARAEGFPATLGSRVGGSRYPEPVSQRY